MINQGPAMSFPIVVATKPEKNPLLGVPFASDFADLKWIDPIG